MELDPSGQVAKGWQGVGAALRGESGGGGGGKEREPADERRWQRLTGHHCHSWNNRISRDLNIQFIVYFWYLYKGLVFFDDLRCVWRLSRRTFKWGIYLVIMSEGDTTNGLLPQNAIPWTKNRKNGVRSRILTFLISTIRNLYIMTLLSAPSELWLSAVGLLWTQGQSLHIVRRYSSGDRVTSCL